LTIQSEGTKYYAETFTCGIYQNGSAVPLWSNISLSGTLAKNTFLQSGAVSIAALDGIQFYCQWPTWATNPTTNHISMTGVLSSDVVVSADIPSVDFSPLYPWLAFVLFFFVFFGVIRSLRSK